jgi:hypothetical protein
MLFFPVNVGDNQSCERQREDAERQRDAALHRVAELEAELTRLRGE